MIKNEKWEVVIEATRRLDRTTPGPWHVAGMPTIPTFTDADIDFVAHTKDDVTSLVGIIGEMNEATDSHENAITTKYLQPTGTKPARVKASDMDGNSVVLSQGGLADGHYEAAKALCRKMGWTTRIVCGQQKPGVYVHVLLP